MVVPKAASTVRRQVDYLAMSTVERTDDLKAASMDCRSVDSLDGPKADYSVVSKVGQTVEMSAVC